MTEPKTFSDENIDDMTTTQLTALRIKEERTKQNLSQQALADHLGMDISNYSRLENGKYEITISKLEAIAEFLKVPVISILPTSLQSGGNYVIENSTNSLNGNGTLINHFTDQEMQKTLKQVIELLQNQLVK